MQSARCNKSTFSALQRGQGSYLHQLGVINIMNKLGTSWGITDGTSWGIADGTSWGFTDGTSWGITAGTSWG